MKIIWTNKDKAQLEAHALSTLQIEQQIERFEKGVESVALIAPCTEGNGIVVLSPEQLKASIDVFTNTPHFSVAKFVPASGAASRMFKHLFEHNTENPLFVEFTQRLRDFPFFDDLTKVISAEGAHFETLYQASNWKRIVTFLLHTPGLAFAHLPKGAIPFHVEGGKAVTPFEEHLYEASSYLANNKKCLVHYTISDLFTSRLEAELLQLASGMTSESQSNLAITFSKQFPRTDTIAVDHSNVPIRSDQGELIFRPGGHGSLLTNLEAMDEDLIFIKNIDNVLPGRKRAEHDRYKKALAGYLIQLISERNTLLEGLKRGEHEVLDAAYAFAGQFTLGAFPKLPIADMISFLDVPLRVAGMVQNQGEPGGGPFWVKDENGTIRKQIIEKAQIDLTSEEQQSILTQSTHFNPVDLVCHIKNERGEKYALSNFKDNNQAFISKKFYHGKPLKALEHPGLWNGSMAQWLTVFVEVPLATFAPVKTVNDLLREAHR